ncbi:MAG: hypothetical protein M3Z36_11490, partial [Acidobacteriota bacterium]|nr:hypothetical protein [Acidobacteriota bacterium]
TAVPAPRRPIVPEISKILAIEAGQNSYGEQFQRGAAPAFDSHTHHRPAAMHSKEADLCARPARKAGVMRTDKGHLGRELFASS